MSKSIIQNNLWTFRKQGGLTQKRVAYFLGHKTTSQLSHYERGVKCPNLTNALKLEIIYHAPAAFLFRDLHRELEREIETKEVKLKRMLECQ
ncbi:MAG: helix-turn-helix domain-containing protein [Candidatus Paceibacterota bacterium]|jgi:transcriptional regulator with XRE-family HTH domain